MKNFEQISWPDWAPNILIEQYEIAIQNLEAGVITNQYSHHYMMTIRILCNIDSSHDSHVMQNVWKQIYKRKPKSQYEIGLVETITNSLLQKKTVKDHKMRERAALEADRLRGIFSQLDMSQESILPILGTKVWSGAINHFLDQEQFKAVPHTSTEWAKEISSFTTQLKISNPGIGSIDQILRTLANRLRDPSFFNNHNDGSEVSRAKHLCRSVGLYNLETIQTPLYESTQSICQIFFPSVIFKARNVLNAADITPTSKGVVIYKK